MKKIILVLSGLVVAAQGNYASENIPSFSSRSPHAGVFYDNLQSGKHIDVRDIPAEIHKISELPITDDTHAMGKNIPVEKGKVFYISSEDTHAKAAPYYIAVKESFKVVDDHRIATSSNGLQSVTCLF